MEPVGFLPVTLGIFFLIGAILDWDWLITNTYFVKLLGRDRVRQYLALIGVGFFIVGLFILVVGQN